LLTMLCEGQHATVLQLPAQPKDAEEAANQQRVDYVGSNRSAANSSSRGSVLLNSLLQRY